MKKALFISLITLVLAITAGGLYALANERVYKQCRAEAGTEISASDFMKKDYTGEIVAGKGDLIDSHVPGVYKVVIASGGHEYSSSLEIVDTVPPEALPCTVECPPGELHPAEDFVTDIKDETAVSVRFAADPNFENIRESQVFVILEDLGGNATKLTCTLKVVPVNHEVVSEAGEGLPAAELFSAVPGQQIAYATEEERLEYIRLHSLTDEAVNTDVPGEYTVFLNTPDGIFPSTLTVKDTVPPVVITKELTVYTGDTPTADDFIDHVSDATWIKGEFVTEPDTSAAGSFTAEAVYTDQGGNSVTETVSYTVMADTEPPVINGVDVIRVELGSTVSYKRGITVTDNRDTDIELTVDSSAVDLGTIGEYEVSYSAVDSSGNETVETTKVFVTPPSAASEEAIAALADSVLAEIITEDMTPKQKAEAIFWWVHGIGYYDQDNHEDATAAAYDGLYLRRGDCYTYAITSQVLLTRAGIDNILIEKIPTRRLHFWNLINIGEGWYHFDACRRHDGSYFFYVTTEELMEYSNKHYGSHNFDPSKYPEIN